MKGASLRRRPFFVPDGWLGPWIAAMAGCNGLAYGGWRFPYDDTRFAYGARLSAYGATSLSMSFATLSC